MFFLLPFVFFLVIILPYFILREGIAMFTTHMNKHNAWWKVPYILITILTIILIILLANGYKW